MKEIDGKLRDFIHSQLEIIDTGLSAANQPVHGRPMIAAMQFVKECLVRVGDEAVDDDFLLRDWFGDILAVTTQWYSNRYGDDLLKHPSDTIPGVVAAFGTPLSMQIPRIAEFETAKPAVKRVVFADGVLEEENPMDWVTPAPKLDGLSADAASALRGGRSTSLHRVAADSPTDTRRELHIN